MSSSKIRIHLTSTGTPRSKREPSIRLFRQLEDTAGEVWGDAEEVIHFPLLPIHRYMAEVSPAVWRGSWPTPQMLGKLHALGVKAAVNLCAERDQDLLVSKNLLFPFNIPILDNGTPQPVQVEFFVDIVSKSAPVYVHCEQGVGRTGVMVAIYRVKFQGWTPQQALKEAEHFGLAMPDQKEFIRNL